MLLAIKYADEVDFIDEDKKALKRLLPKATETWTSDMHKVDENETSLRRGVEEKKDS